MVAMLRQVFSNTTRPPVQSPAALLKAQKVQKEQRQLLQMVKNRQKVKRKRVKRRNPLTKNLLKKKNNFLILKYKI